MADFLDKMISGINKGVATVSTGSKTMIEKSKINTVIKSLEDEKKELSSLLGNKVYKFCTENEEGDVPREDVISICNEITNRIRLIEEQKRRIIEIENEMNQVTGARPAAPVGAVCTCGQPNAVGAKFCARCGKPLA